jgi:hypothetical protein
MPMSMKELDLAYRRTYRRLITGIFIVYAALLLTVISVLIVNPKVATWVSEAVRAGLVGGYAPPAHEPMRLAQPGRPIRTVKSD